MEETDFDEMSFEEKIVPATQEINDEYQIRCAIAEFYEIANSINDDNRDEVIEKLTARANVIFSMVHVYLAKFNNKLILDDYTNTQKKVLKETSDKDGKCDPFTVELRLIETVGLFLGIRENLSEKISEQLLTEMAKEQNNNKGGIL